LPDVPNVVRFTMFGTLGTDTNCINRFYQKYGGPPNTLTGADALTLATGVATEWNTHLSGDVTPGYTLTAVEVQDLSSHTGATALATVSHPGTDAITQGNGALALIVKEVVDRRFRGGHYRQYIGGIGVGHLATEQKWDATFLANFVSDYTAFRAAISGHFPAALRPSSDVGVSFYSGFTNVTGPTGRSRPRSNVRGAALVDQVSGFAGNPKPGSQRRRNLQSS
jgi:hypothetical protein